MIRFALGVLLALSGAACALAAAAPEGRSVCTNSSSNLCLIPFFAIFFSSQALEGETVATQGYLGVQGQGYYLFPTYESLKYHEVEAAIILIGEDRYFNDIDYLNRERVRVIGTFHRSGRGAWGSLTLHNKPQEVPLAVRDE